MKNAIVMAAGRGTRMKSEKCKVLHSLIDRPMLDYTIDALRQAGVERIVLIAGYQAEALKERYPELEIAIQEPQLGTGHAVMQATMLEDADGDTIVVNGDAPCLQPETMQKLFDANKDNALTFLSCVLEDGAHYGRVIRDANGVVEGIVEAKDCTDEQKKVGEINVGLYVFKNKDLFNGLKELKNDNAQNEYYLTDLVKILKEQGKAVDAMPHPDMDETMGINDNLELNKAYVWWRDRICKDWMKKGVQIVDPARTVIGKDVEIGHDVVIEPDTTIVGKSVIGDYTEILAGSFIEDSTIGEDCLIDHAKIVRSTIEEGMEVEPFTYVKDDQIIR